MSDEVERPFLIASQFKIEKSTKGHDKRKKKCNNTPIEKFIFIRKNKDHQNIMNKKLQATRITL